MAVTAVTATALAPARHAGRGDQLPLSAELGGECRQVEQVEQSVAPPLARGPVIEMPEAFVRRVQDCPQDRALGPRGSRKPVVLCAPWLSGTGDGAA